MINLIWKDITVQKKRSFLFIIVYILLFSITFSDMGEVMFTASITATAYLFLTTACYYDDKNKSEILLNCLPIKRTNIVLAKYLTIFVYIAINSIVYTLIRSLMLILSFPMELHYITFNSLIGGLLGISLISSIYLPFFFKYGYAKTKYITVVLFLGLFIIAPNIITFFGDLINKLPMPSVVEFANNLTDTQITVFLLAFSAILLLVSTIVSIKIYENKEF